MALSNYSGLQASVASWLNRSDLTSRIPDFITLAETRLNRTLRLRVMEEETAIPVAAGVRTFPLPTGFLEPLELWRPEGQLRVALRYLAPSQIEVDSLAGRVYFWTITGANVEFERPTNQALSLTFRYLKSFALSDASPTNWLLTNHPDAYLAGALMEAYAGYLRDDQALGIWSARYDRAIAEINLQAGRSRSLTTLSTEIPAMRRYRRYDYR